VGLGVTLFPFQLDFISVEAKSSDSKDELAEAHTEADEVHQKVTSFAAAQEAILFDCWNTQQPPGHGNEARRRLSTTAFEVQARPFSNIALKSMDLNGLPSKKTYQSPGTF
jgi:hypothetical protein